MTLSFEKNPRVCEVALGGKLSLAPRSTKFCHDKLETLKQPTV